MKHKSKNTKKTKYAFGTGMQGTLFDLSSDLLIGQTGNALTQLVKTIRDGERENRMVAKNTNPLMALGGLLEGFQNVEVEGDEMLELPNGESGQFKGANHENGGIDVSLPEGSKIYSKRLKINGKKLSDRKKAREKKENQLKELSKKSVKDKIIDQTLERTSKLNDIEDQMDMRYQENVNKFFDSMSKGGLEPEFKHGGTIDFNIDVDSYLKKMALGGEVEPIDPVDDNETFFNQQPAELVLPDSTLNKITDFLSKEINALDRTSENANEIEVPQGAFKTQVFDYEPTAGIKKPRLLPADVEYGYNPMIYNSEEDYFNSGSSNIEEDFIGFDEEGNRKYSDYKINRTPSKTEWQKSIKNMFSNKPVKDWSKNEVEKFFNQYNSMPLVGKQLRAGLTDEEFNTLLNKQNLSGDSVKDYLNEDLSQEQQDEALRQMLLKQSSNPAMAYGGKVYANGGPIPRLRSTGIGQTELVYPEMNEQDNIEGLTMPENTGSTMYNIQNPSFDMLPMIQPDLLETNSEQPNLENQPLPELNEENNSILKQLLSGLQDGESTVPELTRGDMMGLAGNIQGKYLPLATTLLNRMETKPNVNFFTEYGADALRANQQAQGLAGTNRDRLLQSLKLRENAARARGRNTARGVNTMRSLDIAADQMAQEGESSAYSNYANQMMQMLNQQAGLENQQDQVVMQGEYQRDLADRQDMDNFYTQLAQNLANVANFSQKTGRDLNQALANEETLNAINQLSKYGIQWQRGKDGKLKMVVNKQNKEE